MSQCAKPYAGLVLPDASDLDVTPYMQSAARCLSVLEPEAAKPPRINLARRMVFGDQLGMRVVAEAESDYGPRIVMTAVARDPNADTEEATAKLLSDTVLDALEHSACDIIEWYSPDVLISREDFIRLRSYVSPLRSGTTSDPVIFAEQEAEPDAQTLQDQVREESRSFREMLTEPVAKDAPDETESQAEGVGQSAALAVTAMRKRLADSSPEEKRLGAASWAMTAVVALYSLPVAVAVAIIGAVRGMDFRLATQSLAVTMLFVALYSSNHFNRIVMNILY